MTGHLEDETRIDQAVADALKAIADIRADTRYGADRVRLELWQIIEACQQRLKAGQYYRSQNEPGEQS